MIWALIQDGVAREVGSLTTAGLSFMLGIWAVVLGIVVWCYKQVLAKNELSSDEEDS